jgi:hypothetical protein
VIDQRGISNRRTDAARVHTGRDEPVLDTAGPKCVTLYTERERQVAGLGLGTERAWQPQH